LNQEAFDIMVKEKIKKDREDLGKFVCNSMPRLKETIGLPAVVSNVHQVFEHSVRSYKPAFYFYQTIFFCSPS
jgi:hypothetical protein